MPIHAFVILCPDYCNCLLAEAPGSASRSLQVIQIAVGLAWYSSFQRFSLDALELDAHIKFKSLVMAYKVKPYTQAQLLRSSASECFTITSQDLLVTYLSQGYHLHSTGVTSPLISGPHFPLQHYIFSQLRLHHLRALMSHFLQKHLEVLQL